MMDQKEIKDISFSILMANYNCARFLDDAINSVLIQTYPKWELIIVDDCSTDNSISKIKPYLNNKNIKLKQHITNLGYGAALKTAADNASKEIIGILDADDKLHKKALEIIANGYKENPEFGFIYSTMWECDAHLKNCTRNRWISHDSPKKTNIFKIKISHFKTFLRSAYLKTSGFNPNQKRAVDKDIIFKLEEVTNFKFVDTPLYYYRWHGKGISQSKSSFIPEYYHYLAKLNAYKRRLNKNIPNFTKKQIYFEYYRIMFYKLIQFFIAIYNRSKIRDLVKKIFEKRHFLPENIQRRLIFMKRLN
ncbi:MAG: glycosyltransferase family 2 protein [Promethearchaeota archaeon]